MTFNKQRILVVEDMDNWRDAFVTLLQDRYDVVLSKTYEEAVILLKNHAFNLAVLDIRLKDHEKYNIQGIELLRLIKSKYSNMPVIILTGHPESVQQQTLENYKPDDFLLKADLDIDMFMIKIDELIEKKLGELPTQT